MVAETRQFFDALCVKHNVECPPPRTTARLLDKVCTAQLAYVNVFYFFLFFFFLVLNELLLYLCIMCSFWARADYY